MSHALMIEIGRALLFVTLFLVFWICVGHPLIEVCCQWPTLREMIHEYRQSKARGR